MCMSSFADEFVIDTDYDNYALLFGCNDIDGGRSEHYGHLLLRGYNRRTSWQLQTYLNTFSRYTDLRLEDHTCSASSYR